MAKYLGTIMTGLFVATSFIVALKKGAPERSCLIILGTIGLLGFLLVVGSSLVRPFEEKKIVRGYGLAALAATIMVLVFYGFFL